MKVMEKLSPEMVEMLQGEKMVFMVTTNAKTGKPQMSVVSWLKVSQDGSTVKIAVGHKGTTIKNIQENSNIALGTIGPHTCYSIQGEATVSDIIEKTMKFRVITVKVQSVEDVIFYGGKVTVQPEYEKTYNPVLAEKLDNEVEELLAYSEVTQ